MAILRLGRPLKPKMKIVTHVFQGCPPNMAYVYPPGFEGSLVSVFDAETRLHIGTALEEGNWVIVAKSASQAACAYRDLLESWRGVTEATREAP